MGQIEVHCISNNSMSLIYRYSQLVHMLKNIEMHSNDKIHHLYIAVFCNIHKGQFTLNNHDLSTSSRDYRAL